MTTEKGMSWFKSIRTRILFAVIVTTTLVLGMSGYLMFQYTEISKTRELEQLAEATADRLSQHIELPLWNVDYDLVGKLLTAEMKEQKLARVEVYDKTGDTPLAVRMRDSDGNIVTTTTPPASGLVLAERSVTHDNKPLGTIRIFITRTHLERELRYFAWAIASMVLAVNIVILVLIGTILGRIVITPIETLAAHAERISHGDFSREIQIHTSNEISRLAANMNRMQLSLKIAIERLTKK